MVALCEYSFAFGGAKRSFSVAYCSPRYLVTSSTSALPIIFPMRGWLRVVTIIAVTKKGEVYWKSILELMKTYGFERTWADTISISLRLDSVVSTRAGCFLNVFNSRSQMPPVFLHKPVEQIAVDPSDLYGQRMDNIWSIKYHET
jgi:hypothetical protein